MPQNFDPKPLNSFFKEVEEQLGVMLTYSPQNSVYPIQLVVPEKGITRTQVTQLLEFIRSQIDLKDAEIAKVTANKQPGKQNIAISNLATQKLAEVYALGFFYDAPED